MSDEPDAEARRRAVERIAALMAEARAGGPAGLLGQGLASPAVAQALAELRALDPALQRRIARAMVQSRGDPDALRAVVDAGSRPAPASRRADTRSAPRPPTVVDARGGIPALAIVVGLVCALLAAAWIAAQ
ncbi:hypothetical protein [Lysobacter sp. N42]|uniref:hypothetical protein n=1 Tax=Lysobacter sp. N42 TaxID=2545719 RepID=UPI001043D639|nr:hypothetical protein [Lysobacter sp. N42]TCZ84646.1 hypothetical protein EYQ95_19875 [Lysobacter sp. N42]